MRLRRGQDKLTSDDVFWAPREGVIDDLRLEGVEAVVHLAGENIAGGRWSRSRKELIYESRVGGTRLLAGALAGLRRKPKVFVCASAVGFYGDREEEVDEDSAPGAGFLSALCRAWEAAAEPAAAAGIRTVLLRIGVVLSPRGGALKKMLPPFKLGAGGAVGGGRQPMAWVALDDAVGAIEFVLENAALSGPVNLTAPGLVTNGEFARTLGAVLGRPVLLPLPAFAVRLLLGEMGEALLLGGAPVRSKRLAEAGYRFAHPELDGALRHVLRRR